MRAENRGGETSDKGFTLVELIVVISILGILAALLIPALVGYIDKAQDRTLQYRTRQCVVAAQSLADEQYAETGTYPNDEDPVFKEKVMKLAEVPDSGYTVDSVKFFGDSAKIEKLSYGGSEAGEKICEYRALDNTYTMGIREDGGN